MTLLKLKLNNWSVTSCRTIKVWEELQAEVDKLLEARLKERPFI